jgi:hypothetical protein
LLLRDRYNEHQPGSLQNLVQKLKSSYRNRAHKFHSDAMDSIAEKAIEKLEDLHIDANAEGGQHPSHEAQDVDLKTYVKNLQPPEGGHNNHETMAQRFHQQPGHLYPPFPPLPPHTMSVQLFGEQIVQSTLDGNPTIAGIIGILQTFLSAVHQMEVEHKSSSASQVIHAYFDLVNTHLKPLEDAYRNKPLFPTREDSSIFISLGAYRDHLLGETLKQAFKNAARPELLYVGAVVQNCFGFVQCRTGVEVVGTDKDGSPKTEVRDREPDVNG